jgi:membrane protein DedA with SNARE-associated domain
LALTAALDWLAQVSLSIVSTLGYPGVFILMVFESMVLPVPSEAVLPPAGWLSSPGCDAAIHTCMDLGGAFLVATLGTLVGSLLSYAMGSYGVRPLLERWGKYVFITPHHIEITHAFFEKRGGGVSIFVSRFIPVVRHLISIPAGSARMPLPTFIAATLAGGAAWNFILLYGGYKLGENWHAVTDTIESTKWTVLAGALVLVAGIAVGWWLKKRRGTQRLPGE